MAGKKIAGTAMAKVLMLLAILQLLAWACDIYENLCLLKWISNSSAVDDLLVYHSLVATKWIIALTGALVAIPIVLRKSRKTF